MTKIGDNRNWVDANYLYANIKIYIYIHNILYSWNTPTLGYLPTARMNPAWINLVYNVFQKLWLA